MPGAGRRSGALTPPAGPVLSWRRCQLTEVRYEAVSYCLSCRDMTGVPACLGVTGVAKAAPLVRAVITSKMEWYSSRAEPSLIAQ